MSGLFAGPSSSSSLFQQLKPTCLALLQNAALTPENTPQVSRLLAELLETLRPSSARTQITPNTVSYVFFPLSTILRRNETHVLPNRVLEDIFRILAVLAQTWWWTSELELWEQLLVLSSGILAGIPADNPKRWDEETTDAIILLSISLLQPRVIDFESDTWNYSQSQADERLRALVSRGQTVKMVPVFGGILNEALAHCTSSNRNLQIHSLELIELLILHYIHDDLIPAVLPGVVSTSTRVAIGSKQSKGWPPGDVAGKGLDILRHVILKAMSDAICLRQGAVFQPHTLDDLAELSRGEALKTQSTLARSVPVPRTGPWLRGSATQVHIALNSLSSILRHPSLQPLHALLNLSADLLRGTRLTLPQSTPLLLSFLLSLASSGISGTAHQELTALLEEPDSAGWLQEHFLNIAQLSISSLPRAMRMEDDVKVEFLAQQIEVIAHVTSSATKTSDLFSHILGPTGGIEKWGWKTLHMLQLNPPPDLFVTDAHVTVPQLLSGDSLHLTQFPMLTFKSIRSPAGYDALERMFRALGRAGGDNSFFSIEWFAQTARVATGPMQSAALWCTARLVEGATGVHVNSEQSAPSPTVPKALDKMARAITRNISESFDLDISFESNMQSEPPLDDDGDLDSTLVEFSTGLQKFETKFDLLTVKESDSHSRLHYQEDVLRRSLSLQVLTVLSAALGQRFSPLLLHSLYPVLNALVSANSFVRASGISALQHISHNMAYASTSNFLLANFDYALDAISQRLTRRQLDIDAAKVMSILVTLVGKDIVIRAQDVVEECFDRLDDFHGYKAVVEGLVAVLVNVLDAISNGTVAGEFHREVHHPEKFAQPTFESFASWFKFESKPKEKPTNQGFEFTPQTALEGPDKTKSLAQDPHPEEAKPPSPAHELTKRILDRSIPFLTHKSPLIRARVLNLMATSVSVLTDSALLPSVHAAWPYVMNRLSDEDTFVVTAAANFVETLSLMAGDFMSPRVWEDVWPRFQKILRRLEAAESELALRVWNTPRLKGPVSAYTNTHRLTMAILRTMTNAVGSTLVPHDVEWELAISFRRLLRDSAQQEIQAQTVRLYRALQEISSDLVWLVLSGTIMEHQGTKVQGKMESVRFLCKDGKITKNVQSVLGAEANQ